MTRHTLKCWPGYFDDLLSGDKTFEVRNGMDRIYEVGDELLLKEWAPITEHYTGRELRMRVTYVMNGAFVPADTWVLAVKKIT